TEMIPHLAAGRPLALARYMPTLPMRTAAHRIVMPTKAWFKTTINWSNELNATVRTGERAVTKAAESKALKELTATSRDDLMRSVIDDVDLDGMTAVQDQVRAVLDEVAPGLRPTFDD